jgi:hypothetical protein
VIPDGIKISEIILKNYLYYNECILFTAHTDTKKIPAECLDSAGIQEIYRLKKISPR